MVRRLLATSVALWLLVAMPAHATVESVIPADDSGPNDTFHTNDALWAVGTANPTTGIGQLCVVELGTGVGAGCETGSWGQPNTIGILGTYHQPIVAPYLAPGTYRILGDNGDPAINVLSEPFTVVKCEVDCTTDIADA